MLRESSDNIYQYVNLSENGIVIVALLIIQAQMTEM